MRDGTLWALDATSGKVLWKTKVGGALVGDAWITEGAAYIGSEDEYLYALE